jgi:outer membrane protein assembly factor BamA
VNWSAAVVGVLGLVAVAPRATADDVHLDPWSISLVPDARAVTGFRVHGHTKVTPTTLGYLAHLHIGETVTASSIAAIEEAILSSELFESVKVTFEDGPDGLVVAATLEDKLSWIAAPTLYVLPTNRAIGVGFVENDLGGRDQKLLLYGQLGTQTSLFFATFLDPAVRGTKWTYRFDVYLEHKLIDEYANPASDPTSTAITRSTTENFLDAGLLVGWNFRWWLVADVRIRGAWTYFRNPHAPDGSLLPAPEKDGWDVTAQARLTLDHRVHRFGVTWGPYLQLEAEPSIPGFDSYGYLAWLARAYYSWRFFGEHELELRTIANGGYHLPFHEEVALGGVGDLRGYPTDQFRGDVNVVFRAEYSVPMFKWWIFAFRALTFYDGGFGGFYFRRPQDRDYLPTNLGPSVFRNDVGGGLRVYVKNVVLPLLGLDYGYGIEARNTEVYFEVGLTDF